MTKDAARRDDEFLVQHLVDPQEWVSDHDRIACNVCSRAFGTFRRKHHCRMCGEVVCSGCTLHKNALLATIGYTRVRVCITCIFSHAQTQKSVRPFSPRSASPTTNSSDEDSRRWLSNHLHSPVSSGGQDHDLDPESPASSEDNQHPARRARAPGRSANNQDTNDDVADPAWTHPWPRPPVPLDEQDRLDALHGLHILDTEPETCFDMICDLAKARLSCPMAAVSFVDEHRQWFKASAGLAHKMIPRKIAFCAYTVYAKEPVVVLDALKDRRFDCNPLVSGAAAVRFYAAAPIIDRRSGHAIGSVFVLDTRPRESCDVQILERLADAASENLPEHVDDIVTPNQEEEAEAAMRQQHEVIEAAAAVHEARVRRASQPPTLVLSAPVAPLPVSHGTTAAASVAVPVTAPGPEPAPAPAAAPVSSPSSTLSLAGATPASNGESMEVLLMRLLTQNTETQQQLANQQLSLNSTLTTHSVQITKLMKDVARMEAKIDSKVKGATAV
ncbi:hypothetical protein P43SY_005441 [Pythium insidiosum]|uniref:FYVE-type domain-containing protein n=1 Tax=Pythium insidiosum TaxID=114742 RepID=A0AAD5LJD7_PYTIN|nr:hypothetical protein P43SY_005441 [Pythium insidiosum]